MLNNFIYAQTKDLFLEALGAGNVLDEAVVFIEDTKEIWNHGHYFAGESIDPKAFAEMQTNVANIQIDKLDKSEAESTYATKEELEEIKWLVLKPDLITFTVDDTEYQAEEGMTWQEYIDSDYNIEGWCYVESRGGISGTCNTNAPQIAYGYYAENVTATIIPGRSYIWITPGSGD